MSTNMRLHKDTRLCKRNELVQHVWCHSQTKFFVLETYRENGHCNGNFFSKLIGSSKLHWKHQFLRDCFCILNCFLYFHCCFRTQTLTVRKHVCSWSFHCLNTENNKINAIICVYKKRYYPFTVRYRVHSIISGSQSKCNRRQTREPNHGSVNTACDIKSSCFSCYSS